MHASETLIDCTKSAAIFSNFLYFDEQNGEWKNKTLPQFGPQFSYTSEGCAEDGQHLSNKGHKVQEKLENVQTFILLSHFS